MSETETLDVEHRLICRVLTAPEDWTTVATSPINDEFFENAQHLRVWRAICAHQREYRQVPTLAVLRQDFPRETYRFFQVHDSVEYLINRLCDARKGAITERGLDEAATLWDAGDYDGAARAMANASNEVHLAVPVADDTDLTKTGDERLAAYLERARTGSDMVGISTGFQGLDKATCGLQPEQLVTLTGYAKAGKSFFAIDIARAAHLAGERPLYIGFEMSNREQAERFDSSRAEISLTRLRNGTLQEREWELLERAVRSMGEMPNSFLLSADRSRTMTLSGIAAKLDEQRPSILIVDGAYMMDDELGEAKMSPRALTNLTQGFKRMAQHYKIPIVITTQSLEWKSDRKKGLGRQSVGYSSSFLQDSDVVVGVETSEEDSTIQILKILASRNCPPSEFFIRREWDLGRFQELDYDPFDLGQESEQEGDLVPF